MLVNNYIVSCTGDLVKQLKILNKNFKIYKSFVTLYHANLVLEKDKNIKELDKKPGSIPYLATTSHSLSHTQFWKEVETSLKASFSSGVNTGYKKK